MKEVSQAQSNIEAVDDIKRRLHACEITYDQALEEMSPIVKNINERGREIAKKHGRRHKQVTAREILR